MNTSQIKAYAPKARQDFIKAVTNRAHLLGLDSSPGKIKPVEVKGDVAFINNQVFPAKVGKLRKSLEARIAKEGFDQVMEHVAYTWFNRFMALRYMELHGYLSHGYRLLSNQSGSPIPEILEYAIEIDLPGLNKEEVMELKLAGNKDEELYSLLIKAQCHALHRAMPFLFERLDDETEILLPDNLLHSGSLVNKLVEDIDEESWEKVEIIGWIYQFYISEKKDQVIGKVVKSEDIPAATQLFTPNWIVKYMVQNSLGRTWLATYPDSPLRKKMEYYIEPAEQTPEVQAELDVITPKSLNPEELTVLDPASGSGHILVEAYDIFKEIYLERGYRTKDIPHLILEKNLYGLDIDDRAAQLTGFALMMKARADNHNIFNLEQPIHLSHFRSIASTPCLDGNVIADALLKETERPIVDEGLLFPETKRQQVLTVSVNSDVQRKDIIALVDLFKDGKTFGSLITIPDDLAEQLHALYNLVNKDYRDDWNKQDKAEKLKPIVEQAIILSKQYDCVVANPPYMGGKSMNPKLSSFAKKNFPYSKSDLFAMFIERNLDMAVTRGLVAMITMHSWMFISSYEELRAKILSEDTIISMAHLGARAFDSIGGEVVSTTAFVLEKRNCPEHKGCYIRLVDGNTEAEKQSALKNSLSSENNTFSTCLFNISATDFKKIPGRPIAYWISDNFVSLYENSLIGDHYLGKEGVGTRNDDFFMRMFWEVPVHNIGREKRWILTDKAGYSRRWYMGFSYLMDWENDGFRIKSYRNPDGSLRSRPQNLDFLFKEGVSWGKVGTGTPSFRWRPKGFGFNDAAPTLFGDSVFNLLSQLNSNVTRQLLTIRGSTMNNTTGVIGEIPLLINEKIPLSITNRLSENAVSLCKIDWDSYETSWDYRRSPLVSIGYEKGTQSRLRLLRQGMAIHKWALPIPSRCIGQILPTPKINLIRG